MEALEVGHLRRVAGIDQRLEATADELDESASELHLLAEEISLAVLAEVRLDDARAAAADAAGVG
jgi:hypothetical protein